MVQSSADYSSAGDTFSNNYRSFQTTIVKILRLSLNALYKALFEKSTK